MRKSKNRYFLPHFCFTWVRPWGNHAKCCMDGKRIRCVNCLAACAHLPITVCEIERDIREKILILLYPLAFDAPVRGFPSECRHPLWYGKTRVVSLPDGGKISKICLFILTWSTNATDGRTDRLHDSIDRACIALLGKNVVCKRNKFSIRSLILSQWREARRGVMWQVFGALKTVRAREFWISINK